MARRNLDLVLVGAAAGFALLTAAVSGSGVARAIPGVVLVLFAPGYALSVALLPTRPSDRFERALLAIGTSIAVAIVVSVGLNAAGVELGAGTWGAALAGVTLLGCVIGARRRARLESAEAIEAPRERVPAGRRLTPALLGSVLAALALVAGALALSRRPASHVRGFTSLWALPSHRVRGAFSVGVTSNELHTTHYLVTALAGRRVVLRQRLTLEPGQSWRRTGSVGAVPPGSSKALRVRLVDAARPDRVYRSVDLDFGGGF